MTVTAVRRCAKWDLPTSDCAHCRGHEPVPGMPVALTSVDPKGPPPASPIREAQRSPSLGYFRVPLLNTLADLYTRLADNLAAISTGRNEDNAAAFAPKPDPRRAPVRVDVLDLIAQIETEIPSLAGSVCDAMGLVRCLAFPHDTDHEGRGFDRLAAALATLSQHWYAFEDEMPEMAREVESWLARLIAAARRSLGFTSAPKPLVVACPSCGQPTIFRVETEQGSIAVCGNPEDLDDLGRRREWSEVEWEDAHPRLGYSK